jgi:hypothetical protein
MPARNAEASITGQTPRELELVVVDDGSGDRTADIVAHMAAGDGRIRLIRAEPLGCGVRIIGAGEGYARYAGWLNGLTTHEAIMRERWRSGRSPASAAPSGAPGRWGRDSAAPCAGKASPSPAISTSTPRRSGAAAGARQ